MGLRNFTASDFKKGSGSQKRSKILAGAPAVNLPKDDEEPVEDQAPVAPPAEEEKVEADAAEPAQEEATDEVPSGTTEDVLSWVDGDPERARAALTAESMRDRPRKTLTSALEGLL